MSKTDAPPDLGWPDRSLTAGIPARPAVAAISDRWWLAMACAAILLLTDWRIGWMALARAELSVDESQYWYWSQHLAFGYFSKPPLIAWVIHLVTGLTGSDSPFAIRLAAPLFHMGTSGLILALATRLADVRTGALAAIAYLTLPAVMIGSMTFSTDTPMLFFLALGLLLWTGLTDRPGAGRAALLGLAFGFGILSKYAMFYALPGLILLAILLPRFRIGWRDLLIAVTIAALVVLPNILWNAQHGFATIRHTAEVAGWAGLRLHFDRAGSFLATQFAVFGPILFAAWLWQSGRALLWPVGALDRALVLLSLPILLFVIGQALLSHALANWAVGAGIAGTILAVVVLQRNAPRLLALSLLLHGTLALALPVLPAEAIGLRLPSGSLLFKRHLGHAEISRFAIDQAARAGIDVIVADERTLLADLFYHTRNGGPQVFAAPVPGPPAHHFALNNSLPVGHTGDVLYLADPALAVPCSVPAIQGEELARIVPGPGWAEGRTLVLLRLPADCWR